MSAEDLKERIRRILVDEAAPALQLDGSEIEVRDVSDGVVQVRLGGLCQCCPSSLVAVTMGLEEELRRRIPEVEYLEVVP